MAITFTKANETNGVDPHFSADDPRVIVKPKDIDLKRFPLPVPDAGSYFWEQFDTVLDYVAASRSRAPVRNVTAQCLQAQRIYTADQGAELVHADLPSEIMSHALKWVLSNEPVFRAIKSVSKSKFTDKLVWVNELLARASSVVSPSSFCTKWHFMVARPEEIAAAIVKGELEAPFDIVTKMKSIYGADYNLLAENPALFTMYPEGCPGHPSFNAMHSAAAGAGYGVFCAMFELSPEQKHECYMTAYNMAMFRSYAGVHFPIDNHLGLWMGQEVVRRWLPAQLEAKGATKTEIKAAINAVDA